MGREEQGGKQGGDKTNGTLQLINCTSVFTCSHAKQPWDGFDIQDRDCPMSFLVGRWSRVILYLRCVPD